MTDPNEETFRQCVREEWIDAMFGRDFYPAAQPQNGMFKPPKQGIGLAGFPSFITYSATIPAPKEVNDTKIGITICRIPLGVYVRLIDIGSEAHAAGIVQGSVLLDINGIGVLGEPSHKLLERLWLFEGHYSPQEYYVQQPDENNLNDHQSQSFHRGPVSLRFIKNGQVYSVVLFSRAPFGISWAPCGNFALIQRTYSLAAASGVTRGCLVAGINGKNLRTMDHAGVALELKSLFAAGNDIEIVCAYTALTSRISLNESELKVKKSRKASKLSGNHEITTGDGLRIRKVTEETLEYGMGTVFTCGVSKDMNELINGAKKIRTSKVADFAIRVASGEAIAPTGWKQPWKQAIDKEASALGIMVSSNNSSQMEAIVPEFPVTKEVKIIASYDALFALLYCLQMDQVNYRDDSFFPKWGDLWRQDTQLMAKRTQLAMVKQLTSVSQDIRSTWNSLALQMVSVLASKELHEISPHRTIKSGGNCDNNSRGSLNEEANILLTELSSSILNAVSFVAINIISSQNIFFSYM
jgi:uncharacterized protein (DUF1778 family)